MARIAIALLAATATLASNAASQAPSWEENRRTVLERLERTRRGELAPVDEHHPLRDRPARPRRGGELSVALPGTFGHLNYAIEADYPIAIVWDELHARLAVERPDGSGFAPELANGWEIADVLVVRSVEEAREPHGAPSVDPSPERWIGTIETRGEPGAEELRARGAEGSSPWFPRERVIRVDRGAAIEFTLRPGVLWHDGEPFGTRDVVFSWACQRGAAGGEKLSAFGNIREVRARAADRVQFVFETQYFQAFDVAAALPLLPAHRYEVPSGRTLEQAEALRDLDRNRNFVGLGPYRVHSWREGERLVLERSPDWFGEAAWADRIVYRFLEPASALRELRAGTLDFAFGISSGDFAVLERDAAALGLVTGFALGTDYMWIGWNCRRGALRDATVRLALSHAFDLEGFLRRYSTGRTLEVVGHQPLIGPAHPVGIDPLPFDVERARELLAKRGYLDRDDDGWVEGPDGERLTIHFLYPSGTAGSIIASFLAEGLAAANVELQHDPVEWSQYLAKRAAGAFDAIFQRWVPDRESDMHQVWHSSGAPLETRSSNYVGYANSKVDLAIERARVTLEPEARWALWRAAQQMIHADQPYRFLYTGASGAAWNARWRGVRLYDGRPTFRLREWFLPVE